MYKKLQIFSIIFIATAVGSPHLAHAFRNWVYLPKMKCFLKEANFATEIIFTKSDSDPELKGFEGELRNYVLEPNGSKKFISGLPFKSVFYQSPGLISGIVGDEFGSSGSFTLTRMSSGRSGTWKYSLTDLGGSTDQTSFRCVY